MIFVKREKRALSVLILAVTLVLSTVFAASAAQSFRLSNQLPPSHFLSEAAELFAAKVKEYSGGEVEIKLFHSAQLFKDTEVVEALQQGLVEMGLVPVNQWSGMIPAADIFGVPFVFADLASIERFLDSEAGALLDGAFNEKGCKVVFWMDYGFVQFLNSKRPLLAPADFKGLKIRTLSTGTADAVLALGGTPSALSSTEMYMALQRGTVDGSTTGAPAAYSRHLYEVQKYMTVCNYSAAQFALQANLKWWEDLSDATRDVLDRAGKDAASWIRAEMARSETEALTALREKGVEIVELDAEQRQSFVEATAPVRDGFVAGSGELGQRLMELAAQVQ